MATKTATAPKATPAKTTMKKTTMKPAPEIEQEQQAEQPTPKAPGVLEQRAALKAAGYKRCPAHLTFLDRLPAEAQQPVAGHEDDVSIRPLTEFGTMSACRACLKVRNAEKRVEAASGRQAQAQRSIERLQAIVNKKRAELAEAEAKLRYIVELEADVAEREAQQQ
jgi:hypothetical protein